MKTSFFLFFFFAIHLLGFSQDVNDYFYKIDNRIGSSWSKMPKDSAEFVKNNQYMLRFNFHSPEIKANFNDFIHRIDSIGMLDSVAVSSRFGKAPDKYRIIIGEKVPIEMSKMLITYYWNLFGDNMELIQKWVRPDIGYGVDGRVDVRTVYVGALFCNYSVRKRYVTGPEVFKLLLDAPDEQSFSAIFEKYDEEKKKFQAFLEGKENRVRFPACEHIEDVELRFKCAREKAYEYFEENIPSDFAYKYDKTQLVIYFDKEGKVTDVKIGAGYYVPENKEVIFEMVKSMPPWIPAKSFKRPKTSYDIYTIKLKNRA